MTKTIIAVIGTTILLAAIPAGFSATRTYDIPFDKATATLFSALHLDPDNTITNTFSVQAKAEGILADHMRMKLYAVKLDDYRPGATLAFTCSHAYNIGASGAEYIRFRIQKEAPDKSKITVDYCDRWVGMWPPFLFWNPGPFRDSKILDQIWKK